MFSKKKKQFPSGTFIPTPARVAAIIQLCLAFTVILWSAGQPFMGELFAVKSKLILYQTVLGSQDLLKKGKENPQIVAKLQRNAGRFSRLPIDQQHQLVQSYQQLQKTADAPFLSKLGRSISIVAFQIPPFELAWIAFSIIISLLLLLRIEGAMHAVWLLPLIVLIYGIDNHWNGAQPGLAEESKLFPSEEKLVQEFMAEPLSPNIFEQQKQLLLAWKKYLVAEWAHEKSSDDETQFDLQVEKGEQAFTIARLAKLPKDRLIDDDALFHRKEPIFLLSFYLLWNLFFAWIVTKNTKKMYAAHTHSA